MPTPLQRRVWTRLNPAGPAPPPAAPTDGEVEQHRRAVLYVASRSAGMAEGQRWLPDLATRQATAGKASTVTEYATRAATGAQVCAELLDMLGLEPEQARVRAGGALQPDPEA